MREQIVDTYQVMSDGVTVWINDPRRCIARLGPLGLDLMGLGDGAKIPPDSDRIWDWFVNKVRVLHGITLAEGHRPDWCGTSPC